MQPFNLNSYIIYVNTKFDNAITQSLHYDTTSESTIKLLNNSDQFNTCNKTEVDLIVSSSIGAAPAGMPNLMLHIFKINLLITQISLILLKHLT